MAIRAELEIFLKANLRDYLSALGLNVKNIHELDKMELGVAWMHKSNWENEPLRVKRSTRFMCALIAAVRELNIKKPDQHSLGQFDKPVWQVGIGSQEARMVQVLAKEQETSNVDAEEEAAGEKFTKVPVQEEKMLSTGIDLGGFVTEGVIEMKAKSSGGDRRMGYYP